MRLGNSAHDYGVIAILLHWLTALLVVAGWLLGTFGDILPRGAARSAGLFVHMSIGLTVLTLVLLRVAWRLADPPPPLEETEFGAWLALAAKATHFLLYGLLVVTPLFGIALQFARGGALPLFGLAEIGSPLARDRILAGSLQEIHATLANGLMIVAGFHAAAALAHHWMLRDRTLSRMLPWVAR